MNINACLSHKSDDWSTPSYLYREIFDLGFFDPCPLHSVFDGLALDWPDKSFVNPPYSNISVWVDKCIQESMQGKLVLMLVPARPDTRWFFKLYAFGCFFTFIKGRLRFNDSNFAPFPSMFVFLRGTGCSSFTVVSRSDVRIIDCMRF